MAIYVLPQPEGRPPYVSGPTGRNINYVKWEHEVTLEEAGYFELWTPKVNGNPEPHHARVHMITIQLSLNIGAPKIVRAFLQSPDESIRAVLGCAASGGLGWKAGVYRIGCPVLATYGSRGILVVDSAPVGLEITVIYQQELI